MFNHEDNLEYIPCCICCKDAPVKMFVEKGFTLNRCNHCGHFYVSPRPSIGIVPELTAEDEPPVEIHSLDEVRRKPHFRRYVETVKQYVPGGKWCDIGCGCGTLLQVAAEAGFDVEGIEKNPERLAYCRSMGLTVLNNDIESNFLPGSFYDVISLINVFSHLRSPVATFSRIQRLLKNNGVILVATSELGKTVYKDEVGNWHIPDHLHFAGPNTFKVIASKFGFRLYYIDRSITQRVVLSEKLLYESDRPSIAMIKSMLRYIPGLVDITAAATCLSKGFLYPRHEVVLILRRSS